MEHRARCSRRGPARVGSVAVVALACACAWPASARAQCLPSDPLLALACNSPCLGTAGGFSWVGAAVFPSGPGLTLGGGMLHQYPVGFEASLHLPTSPDAARSSFLAMELAARVTLLREGLSGGWNRRPPDLALVMGMRLGVGLVAGDSESPSVVFGPWAELLIDESIALAIRPAVAVNRDREPGPGGFPLDVHPLVELTLGWVSFGTYEQGN